MKYFYSCGILFLTVLFTILHVSSCKVIHKSAAAATVEKNIEPPRIIFLNYAILNDKLQGEYKISLINKIISEGKIKESISETHKPEIDDLECIVLDKESNIMKRNYIANPLIKSMEYVSEGGILAAKVIKLDSAKFSIRLQLELTAKYIVLKKYTGINSKNIHLLTTDIY